MENKHICAHCAGTGFSLPERFTKYKKFKLDSDKCVLHFNKKIINLTKVEERILSCLLLNHGRVIKREYILSYVWNSQKPHLDTRLVDVYIGYLRKKIGRREIVCVKYNGYIID